MSNASRKLRKKSGIGYVDQKGPNSFAPRVHRTPKSIGGLVRIVLPTSNELRGNTEGVWAMLSANDKDRYDRDYSGFATATLMNDSYLYPELRFGDTLQIRLRSTLAPAAIFEGQLDELSFNPLAGNFRTGSGSVQHAIWQVRPFKEDEHVALRSGANTLGFTDAWLFPGATHEDIEDAVNDFGSRCTHHTDHHHHR